MCMRKFGRNWYLCTSMKSVSVLFESSETPNDHNLRSSLARFSALLLLTIEAKVNYPPVKLRQMWKTHYL